jgi:hypothetical protein
VATFTPSSNTVTTGSGRTIGYDILIVAAGLNSKFDAITGLSQALANPSSGVSSIYSYETCDKVWSDIESLRSGKAVFTQPAGVIKCAGGRYPMQTTSSLITDCENSAPENHVDGMGPIPPHEPKARD